MRELNKTEAEMVAGGVLPVIPEVIAAAVAIGTAIGEAIAGATSSDDSDDSVFGSDRDRSQE